MLWLTRGQLNDKLLLNKSTTLWRTETAVERVQERSNSPKGCEHSWALQIKVNILLRVFEHWNLQSRPSVAGFEALCVLNPARFFLAGLEESLAVVCILLLLRGAVRTGRLWGGRGSPLRRESPRSLWVPGGTLAILLPSDLVIPLLPSAPRGWVFLICFSFLGCLCCCAPTLVYMCLLLLPHLSLNMRSALLPLEWFCFLRNLVYLCQGSRWGLSKHCPHGLAFRHSPTCLSCLMGPWL